VTRTYYTTLLKNYNLLLKNLLQVVKNTKVIAPKSQTSSEVSKEIAPNLALKLSNRLLQKPSRTSIYELAPKNRRITPEITEELAPKSRRTYFEIAEELLQNLWRTCLKLKKFFLRITKHLHKNLRTTSTKVPRELSPESLSTCSTVTEEKNE